MPVILPMKASRCASELRRLLHDGVLAQRGSIDLGGGILMPLDIACRIVLTDLDDLIDHAANNGSVARDRLQQLSDELEELHACAAPASSM
jgi:hypothetical protein